MKDLMHRKKDMLPILYALLIYIIRSSKRVTMLTHVMYYVQWTLVIVNSVLSPILFTNERFSLLPESMSFSFIAYNR